jgi:hypothetical protein
MFITPENGLLLFGRSRLLRQAALALVVLFALLVPLVLINLVMGVTFAGRWTLG